MKLIQLIKDFRKWRRSKYEDAIAKVCSEIADRHYSRTKYDGAYIVYREGLRYGIEHRKEILKRVKI